MSDESMWIERAQSAEARLHTATQVSAAALTRIKEFKTNFGIREKQDGSIEIDYGKFVARLGAGGWLELRAIGDEHWQVSGEPGAKPRIRVVA